MADKMITLVASDGNKFEVKANFKNLSEMVRDWINTFGENTPVPVNRISGATILKMIEWTEHYNYEPPNLDNVDKELWPNNIPVWDKKFLDDVGFKAVTDLTNAAHFISYHRLLVVGVRYVASKIKGKNQADIKELVKSTGYSILSSC